MSRSVSFTLTNDTDTVVGDNSAPSTVTITEQADGSLSFTVTNVGGETPDVIADIRGLAFNLSDDNLWSTLSYDDPEGYITAFDQDGEVDANWPTPPSVSGTEYEVGLEFGSPGAAANDYQTVSFSLSSSLRPLTLDDFALESFTVRQTSVGEDGTEREYSDKLWGDAPYPVNAIDDEISVNEDAMVAGNLFDNDIDLDAEPGDLTLTGVTLGGEPVAADGSSITIADGVVLVINADGSYSVDASDADYLSQDESLTFAGTYMVDDGNGGSDEAAFTITVNGVNDAPEAVADSGNTDEGSVVTGNVLTNDSDIDRLDTFEVTAVNGAESGVNQPITLASGAIVTLNADGTYAYDPNGAWDALNDGEVGTDVFSYTITDSWGAMATTTVEISIDGYGGGGGGGGGDNFGTFTNKKGVDQEISNIVMYLSDGDGITKVKVDGWSDETDLDDVDLSTFLGAEFSGYELLAVSIKAGNNHNKDLGPGEGQLFLIDGDENIDYEAGGDTPEGISADDLAAHADYSYDYDSNLFAHVESGSSFDPGTFV